MTDPVVAETPEQNATPVKTQKVKKSSVRAMFGGPMLNPLTEDVFTGEPSKPVVLDAWLKVQIEAGKIETVED